MQRIRVQKHIQKEEFCFLKFKNFVFWNLKILFVKIQ